MLVCVKEVNLSHNVPYLCVVHSVNPCTYVCLLLPRDLSFGEEAFRRLLCWGRYTLSCLQLPYYVSYLHIFEWYKSLTFSVIVLGGTRFSSRVRSFQFISYIHSLEEAEFSLAVSPSFMYLHFIQSYQSSALCIFACATLLYCR